MKMMMKIITATIAIARALSHPVSKKCRIRNSQTKNIIMAPIRLPTTPSSSALNITPMSVPRNAIQSASVNFALLLPASSLPAIQSTGARIIVETINCIIVAMISISLYPSSTSTLDRLLFKLKHYLKIRA